MYLGQQFRALSSFFGPRRICGFDNEFAHSTVRALGLKVGESRLKAMPGAICDQESEHCGHPGQGRHGQ